MDLVITILLIVILILLLFCLGILIAMLQADKRQTSIIDMFLKCFDDLTRTIEAYYELTEKVLTEATKTKNEEDDK